MISKKKLGLLASLYFAQGLPFGFFVQALPVLLQKSGLSLAAIGGANALMLPWAMKFLWSPFIDQRKAGRLGRRRGAIVPLQLLSAALFFGLAIPGGTPPLPFLLVSVVLVNLLAATQDIATDGLAVDILEGDELGWGNGLQVAAYRVGMVVGGGFLLAIFESAGARITFGCLGALLLVSTLPIALFREPPSEPPPRESPSLSFWLKRPGALPWLGLLCIYKLGEAFAMGMLRPWLVDAKGAGLGMTEVGWIVGTVGFSAGLVGAMLGGGLVRRLGYRASLLTFGLLQAGSVFLYSLVAQRPTIPTIAVVTAVEHLASGMATVALFTAMMEVCRPEHAGADYTTQASVVVIATGLAATVSGVSAQALGYSGHFTFAAGLAAVAVLFVAVFFPKGDLAKVGAQKA